MAAGVGVRDKGCCCCCSLDGVRLRVESGGEKTVVGAGTRGLLVTEKSVCCGVDGEHGMLAERDSEDKIKMLNIF